MEHATKNCVGETIALETLSVAIPAAGCGARTGLDGNKILAPLHAHPLLWWTLRNLTAARPAKLHLAEILIAARPDEWPLIEAALPAELDAPVRVLAGGASRQESVYHLTRAAQSKWILVHDAARPLVSAALTERVCAAARQSGAALAARRASDTVKRAQPDSSHVAETLERAAIWLAQTPQVFRRRVLLAALQQAERENFAGTDCASLVERLRDENGQLAQPVTLVEGEEENFKVTFSADLERAAIHLRAVEAANS